MNARTRVAALTFAAIVAHASGAMARNANAETDTGPPHAEKVESLSEDAPQKEGEQHQDVAAEERKTKAQANAATAKQQRASRAAYEEGKKRWKRGDKNGALEKLDEAIGIYPHWAAYYVYRGAAYVSLKHLDEARKDYEKALELKPGSKAARNGLKRIDQIEKIRIADRTRRNQLHAEIGVLKAKRRDVGIAAPIAVLVVGGIAMVVSVNVLSVALQSEAGSQVIQIEDTEPLFIGSAVGLAGGALFAIVGGGWLASRIKTRRQLDDTIELRQRELDRIPVAITSVGLDPRRGLVAVGGRF